MRAVHFIFLFSIAVLSATAQTYPPRTSKHIFWQPGIILTTTDFKGDTIGKYRESFKKANLQALAYTGLWSVLDVPKKKKDRGKMLEKVYIVPAFDMLSSFTITNDPNEMAIQQIYFDINELSARHARQRLHALQDSAKSYGILWTMYSTVMANIKAAQAQVVDSYTKDIIVNKTPGALVAWRKRLNDELNKTSAWATKPEDHYRFITNQPIDKDYEKSSDMAGVITN